MQIIIRYIQAVAKHIYCSHIVHEGYHCKVNLSVFCSMPEFLSLCCVPVPILPYYLVCQKMIKYVPIHSISNAVCQNTMVSGLSICSQYAGQHPFLPILTHNIVCSRRLSYREQGFYKIVGPILRSIMMKYIQVACILHGKRIWIG